MELNELAKDAFYWNTYEESVQRLLAVDTDDAGELAVAMYSAYGGILYGSCTKPEHLQPVTAEQMAAIGRDIDGNLLPPTPTDNGFRLCPFCGGKRVLQKRR